MANNYRQFSAALKLENDGEREWAAHVLEELRRTPSDGGDPVDHEDDLARYESMADFDFDFEADVGLWFHADESGNVENIASFVQDYLRKFHPDLCWEMEWADICEKPRIGEFGGGAVFVTAKKIEWNSTSNWLNQKATKFAKTKKAP